MRSGGLNPEAAVPDRDRRVGGRAMRQGILTRQSDCGRWRQHEHDNDRRRRDGHQLSAIVIGLIGELVKAKIEADLVLHFAMRRLLRAGSRRRRQRAQAGAGRRRRLRKEHGEQRENSRVPTQA